MKDRNWTHILLAAVSAFYFGWLYSKKETEPPYELQIGNENILLPSVVGKLLGGQ